jgi:hypothetical protein
VKRLAAVLLLATLALAVPRWATAQGADAQGWWWTAHQQGIPAPPAPPDVAADDLLVQGGDVLRLAGQPPSPTAVAALRFHIAPGESVSSLALAAAAGGTADDVRAYATTSTWQPVQGGPLANSPAPDVTRYSAGLLSADGAALVFPDVGRLVTEDGLLSLVLVAGPTDRVVLHRPLPTALTVQEVPFVQAPVLPVPAAVPPAAPATVLLPVRPLTAPVAAPPAVQAPAAQVAEPPLQAVVAPVRHLVADDRRTRVVVALEAVLLLFTFGLLGQGPMAAAARLLGPQPVDDGERGVGRFRRPREGSAPRL